MTVEELIARLSDYDPKMPVMILDGFNGGGSPRDLNLGPTPRTISTEDADETADCEGQIGKEVVALGFGCY